MTFSTEQWRNHFESLVNNSDDFIALATPSGKMVYVNDAGKELVSLPDDLDISDTHLADFVTSHGTLAYSEEMDHIFAGENWKGTGWLRNWTNNKIFAVQATSIVLTDPISNEPVALATIRRDLREINAVKLESDRLRLHDPLTGLSGRSQFEKKLEESIARSIMNGRYASVLFVDVDRFHEINASLGHFVADGLLVQVANRLRNSAVGAQAISRFGGDEFLILLENLTDKKQASEIARRLIVAFDEPFVVEKNDVFVSVSIGVCFGNTNASQMIVLADQAVYQAKSRGRARFEIIEATLGSQVADDHVSKYRELHLAIDRGELFTLFQPIVRLTDKKIVAAEALVRWMRPNHGIVPPLEFIHLAESTGLISRIGELVLKSACALIKTLNDQGVSLRIAINVSQLQLVDPNFALMVTNELIRYEVSPGQLTLEVTESVAMDDIETIGRTIAQLKEAGTLISIDDFGTGYSSVRTLRHLPFDTLKIDREFVSAVDELGNDYAVVRAIIAMANALGLSIVAEGVETSDQQDSLVQLGCPYAQGFLYSHPISEGELVAILTFDDLDNIEQSPGFL